MRLPNPLRLIDFFSAKRDPFKPKPAKARWGRCVDRGPGEKFQYENTLRWVTRDGVRHERVAVSRVGITWYWKASGIELSLADWIHLEALKRRAEVIGFAAAEDSQ